MMLEELFERELKIQLELYELNRECPNTFMHSCFKDISTFSHFIHHYYSPRLTLLPAEVLIDTCKKCVVFRRMYLQYIIVRLNCEKSILRSIITISSYDDLNNVFTKTKLLNHILLADYKNYFNKFMMWRELDQWIDIDAYAKYNVKRPYILSLLACINNDWIKEEHMWQSIIKFFAKNPLQDKAMAVCIPEKYKSQLASLILLKKLK